jgi:hypothetical protein
VTERFERVGKLVGDLQESRVVVVLAEGPLGLRDMDVGLGSVLWVRDHQWFVTLVCKLALDLGPPNGVMVPRAAPSFELDKPSRFAATDLSLLDHASDFAPFKAEVDVVVVGHARAPRATPSSMASLRVLTGSGEPLLVTAAAVRAGAPASTIPLAAPYIAGSWAGAASRWGPASDPHKLLGGYIDADTDPRLYQAASPEMRIASKELRGDEQLVTVGLFEGGIPAPDGSTFLERVFQLPGLYPVITYDAAEEGQPVEVMLDTVALDSDNGVVTLTWRGTLGPFQNPDELRRVVLSMERLAIERSESDRLSDTQRGVVRFAWTEDDAQAGKAPPEEDPILEMHKFLTWGETAPEPRVPIERYARVSAELAEWPDKREETLKRHGFKEERYLLEERCWLERFAADAVEGHGELAAYFGELFVREQDQLATPEEERVGLRDYLSLRLAMEIGADVAEVLGQAKMTLAQWMRLDRRWTARAEADPEVAREMAEIDANLRAEVSDDLDDDTADELPDGVE